MDQQRYSRLYQKTWSIPYLYFARIIESDSAIITDFFPIMTAVRDYVCTTVPRRRLFQIDCSNNSLYATLAYILNVIYRARNASDNKKHSNN
ncbi:hypothetical protein CYJ32_01980 [Alloscardovia omnicolens]|uniref:Uncharacterized protein n=1 Tax=Alloscardovia omnicolens TaxID=419015 RepID=A0A2I1M7W1_9BIFI|nr:hypothetical protein CYJ32_01980 [Alloscardovia omnicolens]